MVKYILIFVISILLASVSQILLKKSANITRTSKIKEYLNIYVITAYLILFISTILTLIAYKQVKLSTGVVIETISYILVPILSFFILKEKIKKNQIIGISLIIIGIMVFSFC